VGARFDWDRYDEEACPGENPRMTLCEWASSLDETLVSDPATGAVSLELLSAVVAQDSVEYLCCCCGAMGDGDRGRGVMSASGCT
jgi:hypothetical protein